MAYTPIGWVTGDTITADLLNKMDNGWSVESSNTTLCEESVTTADDGYGVYSGMLAYSTTITASRLTVTFNGTEYTCTGTDDGYGMSYGAPWSDALDNYDFSTYPFNVYSESGYGNKLATESAGTYTIKIAESSESIEVSDDFAKVRGFWNIDTTLTEESITTASGNMGYNASLSYATPISADSLRVTFDGTEYTCTKSTAGNVVGYGGFTSQGTDFSTYPFAIVVMNGTNYVYTESAGTYTIKIVLSAGVETSDDFQSAVNSAVNAMPMECVSGTTTYSEMDSAYDSGRILFFKPYSNNFSMYFITFFNSSTVTFFPTDSSISVGFTSGVFRVSAV